MKNRVSNIFVWEYIKITCIIILFVWISFFPQPMHDKYWLPAQIFLGIFLLILMLNKKYLKHLFSFQDWPLWLFLISMLAGIVNGTDRNLVLRTYFYLTVTFFFIFYIGKGIFLYTKDIKLIIIVICICSCIIVFIGLAELYFGRNALYENFINNPYYARYVAYYPRPMSTQFNPAVLGSFLLGCLPFSLYFLKSDLLKLRILSISSFLLSTAIIIWTFSRGVFLGFIVCVLFYSWKKGKRKLLALFSFCLALFILICSYQKDSNLNRFGYNRLISGSYDSVLSEYRFKRIDMTFKIVKDYPLFGIGFNHFRLRFNEYADRDDIREWYEFKIPDNMYLTFLAETGFIGTTGFLIFIFFLLRRGLKRLKELEDENKKQALLLSITAMIGLLVNMGGYELFYWNNPYMLFCLLSGFIQALSIKRL